MADSELGESCVLLRSLHRPGTPVLLPNAWDVPTAVAVVEAGFPAVATTSAGVAASLGYADHERAPREEMLAAAARIARAVAVPVTVDAEAGYGLAAGELVAALYEAGVAGCNLEDTDHAAGALRQPHAQARWLGEVRRAASEIGYPLVINARVDVFVGPVLSGAGAEVQAELVADAVQRANAYLDAGADCVYPILLSSPGAVRRFVAEAHGAVNVLRLPHGASVAELAAMGVARVSWGSLLHAEAMVRFAERLAAIRRQD